jgi:hypothetical protein
VRAGRSDIASRRPRAVYTARRIGFGIFDTLHSPAHQIRGGLGSGHQIQKTQNIFHGVQSPFKITTNGGSEQSLQRWSAFVAYAIGAFQEKINCTTIFFAESLSHDRLPGLFGRWAALLSPDL